MTIARADPAAPTTRAHKKRRVLLRLEGIIQGVGFRPYVNRLALSLGLTGWVANSGDGVTVDIEGAGLAVDDFLQRLTTHLPPLARLDRLERDELIPIGHASFVIRQSISGGERTALVLPDVATCDDCLNEILSPTDRRYRYPFTNCTNCGPRFSILEALPYDRMNTTMRRFTMCKACRAEYETPSDRRFHAQPNACPDCGPRLALLDSTGAMLAERHQALLAAADGLRNGKIVAIKGLGGFQLLVDARDGDAVADLRRRKARPAKPFAVMGPSLQVVDMHCRISDLERELLTSPAAPIVLLHRRARPRDGEAALAQTIAPGNPLLGIMLPYTPLHHLLLREVGFPVVATSGNFSGEPLVTDETDALDRLAGLADLFLVHDRPIACALDDSVVRAMAGRGLMLRRARGYAPLPVALRRPAPALLAIGGHLKAAAATTVGSQVIVGPHVGDLDTALARQAFHHAIDRLCGLHVVRPAAVVCDRHPDYYTTRVAQLSDMKVIAVQHHVAHIVACMAENGIEGPVLGVAWDGTGYGDDGTICGGELILVDGASMRRVAHLAPFPLPGGEKAVTEPRRAAIGLLYELSRASGASTLTDTSLEPVRSFSATELRVLERMLARSLNTPRTSSVGRLFDAVASLIGLAQRTSFEGQAAMALEFALDDNPPRTSYQLVPERAGEDEDGGFIVDWRPMVRALLSDIERGASVSEMAAAFHNALIDAIVAVARRVGETRVVLTGGCFQNRYLTEGAVGRLRQAGFEPFWHQHVPPNDGGLALGQAVWAARLVEAGAA